MSDMAVAVIGMAWVLAARGVALAAGPAPTGASGPAPVVFPGAQWQQRPPAQMGIDPAKLQAFIDQLCTPSPKHSRGPTAGDADPAGVIVKDGYIVASWGPPEGKLNWFSSSKPVLATLLLFAVQEGRLASVDSRIADLGWPLSPKDQPMTFAHLANMISGYSLPEAPGAAWAYNDYAIHLYALSLDRVYPGEGLNEPAARLLADLQLQDGDVCGDAHPGYGVVTSPRDFARIGWWWMHRGNWNGKQVLDASYFNRYCKPCVPADLPVSRTKEVDDYLNIASYGGGNNQTKVGPGLYGYNWWFNAPLPGGEGRRVWPELPDDAFAALGYNGNCMFMIPSRGVLVAARGYWGEELDKDPRGRIHQTLHLLMDALGHPGEGAGSAQATTSAPQP